jgi:CDGSH-type Zn-finger protein
MRKLILLVVTSTVLAGCATQLPTCDGSHRRVINAPAQAGIVYPSCGIAA